jgi:hypothetical protein
MHTSSMTTQQLCDPQLNISNSEFHNASRAAGNAALLAHSSQAAVPVVRVANNANIRRYLQDAAQPVQYSHGPALCSTCSCRYHANAQKLLCSSRLAQASMPANSAYSMQHTVSVDGAASRWQNGWCTAPVSTPDFCSTAGSLVVSPSPHSKL